VTSANTAAPGAPRAPETPVRRGRPSPRDVERLRATVGVLVRHERQRCGWGVGTLAATAGVNERTIRRIEQGTQRVSKNMIYRIARALRTGADDLAIAALAERLCDAAAAGSGLVDHSRKPHRRRARIAALVRGETGEDTPADVVGDDMGALILAELIKRTAAP